MYIIQKRTSLPLSYLIKDFDCLNHTTGAASDWPEALHLLQPVQMNLSLCCILTIDV